jgi:uncharacterized alkaline shock family protein YloU
MEKQSKKSNRLDKQSKDIIDIVRQTAMNSYGVIAIANKDEINLISKLTKKGKMEEGIFVTKRSDDTFAVSIYLVLAQEIKITEALRECQKSIKFVLEKKYPKMCREVNVYVIELR